MNTEEYVRNVLMDHLLDEMRYTIPSSTEAAEAREKAHDELWNLVDQHKEDCSFSKAELNYFERSKFYLHKCRNSKFYGLLKVHNNHSNSDLSSAQSTVKLRSFQFS